MTIHTYPAPPRERGVILIVSLIFLIILSFLGLTSLRVSTMQERMSGNMRDRGIAFQAAESALRGAETYLAETIPKTIQLPSATFSGDLCASKGVYKLVDGTPYFVAQNSSFSSSGTKWDGASPDFWNEYPWETNNCSYHGSEDYVTYVTDDDLGKPGKPTKLPRYVIEEISSTISGTLDYRVTAIGWGSSENAVVVVQATYAGSN